MKSQNKNAPSRQNETFSFANHRTNIEMLSEKGLSQILSPFLRMNKSILIHITSVNDALLRLNGPCFIFDIKDIRLYYSHSTEDINELPLTEAGFLNLIQSNSRNDKSMLINWQSRLTSKVELEVSREPIKCSARFLMNILFPDTVPPNVINSHSFTFNLEKQNTNNKKANIISPACVADSEHFFYMEM